jgi:Domain of unknown function (DUF4112)
MPVFVPISSGFPAVPTSQDARWTRGAWIFRDQFLDRLEYLLEEVFRVPGTRMRFGIDGIVGLVPAAGSVLAGLFSLVIPLAGWVRGIPYVALVRMAINVGIGVLIGSIPLFGDIFDIAWKANHRNLRLLRRHLGTQRRQTWHDRIFLLALVGVLGAIFAIPIVLAVWLVLWMVNH